MHISVKFVYGLYCRNLSVLNSIFKDENWLLVFESGVRKCFLAVGSNGKTILGPREEKFGVVLLLLLVALYVLFHC